MRDEIFLPFVIDIWGGIENWQSGNRENMYRGKIRYSNIYNGSPQQRILNALKKRFARSGRFRVETANRLLWEACCRYSGAPERSFEAGKLDGIGVVVTNQHGVVVPSCSFWDIAMSWEHNISSVAPYSVIGTRKVPLWDGWTAEAAEAAKLGIAYTSIDAAPQAPACRFCGQFVNTTRFRRHHDRPHCQRRECRHMAWLANTSQSRGGIDLTPRQRNATPAVLFDQVRVINYLSAKAAEAKRSSQCRT